MEAYSIFEELKQRIVHLELPPESVLNISELAETFGVSRTPVKETLIALQAEEWVVRQGSHFMVTPLSLERIREINEIRMVLEPQAHIWAMERITPRELEILDELRGAALAMDLDTSDRAIVDLDSRIHSTIFRASRNAQLAATLERILAHYLRFWLSVPRNIKPKTFFAEALALMEAIQDKDEDRVRESTIRHIRTSVSEIFGTG